MEIKKPKIKGLPYNEFKDNEYIEELLKKCKILEV